MNDKRHPGEFDEQRFQKGGLRVLVVVDDSYQRKVHQKLDGFNKRPEGHGIGVDRLYRHRNGVVARFYIFW